MGRDGMGRDGMAWDGMADSAVQVPRDQRQGFGFQLEHHHARRPRGASCSTPDLDPTLDPAPGTS